MRDEAADVMRFARARAIEAVEAGRAGSIGDLVRVEQRMASLLGLDAPAEIVMHTPSAGEIEGWVASMTLRSVPALEEVDVVGDEYGAIEATATG